MSVREQLLQLKKNGWEVRIIGATIFDTQNGTTRLKRHWDMMRNARHALVKIKDGPLVHNLVKTRSTVRSEMTADEEGVWYRLYTRALDRFKPDIVYFYGGRTLDLLIGDEAQSRGIAVAAYLANGNFRGTRWCRDVDLIITNSRATASMYRRQDGIDTVPLEPFVDPSKVMCRNREPAHVLAINPSLSKGGAIVAATAARLETRRPDVKFEIVESRERWDKILTATQKQLDQPIRPLKNVIKTPIQRDIRPVYARAGLVLILSLWWESLPRVAIEAILNGIPCIGTDYGGTPEAIGDAGIILPMPKYCHSPPYNRLPDTQTLELVANRIEDFFDNERTRVTLENAAQQRAKAYDLDARGRRLSELFLRLSS